jgi:peptidoglycan/xylan/chitin deacetylase (PgdA/CDA1 family)
MTLAASGLASPLEAHELAARNGPAPGTASATVYTSCSVANTAALTFDDGPYIYETSIVNTLNKAGIKGTFFLNGGNWACIYDAANVKSIQAAYAAGHEIGSHTWHHWNLSTLTWDNIHDEMYRTELALQRIIGVQPALMRPPYGAYNTLVRQASHVRGQVMVTWDFDSRDSDGATAAQSNTLYDQFAAKSPRPKSVLALNHETYATTANTVLPHAISVLKAKNYKFVTVSECLGIKPYQWTAASQARTADWHC